MAFDAEATRLGSGWLAALCTGVEPERAEALRTEAHTLVTSWRGQDEHFAALLRSDRVASWFLVEAAMRAAEGPARPGYAYNRTLYALSDCWHHAADRVEAPWQWLEACLALRDTERAAQFQEGLEPFGVKACPALLCALSKPERRTAELARVLLRFGGVTKELALEWILDPRLRNVAQEYFRADVRRHEGDLRALLERATGSQRKPIAELLREVDPSVALSAPSSNNTEEKLLERLRVDPLDDEAHSVWSDMLMARGDPRGEMIVLERALRAAPVAEQAALSANLAEHVASHAKQLWDKPGGYPHRDRYRGRSRFECAFAIPTRGAIETWVIRTLNLGRALFGAALPTTLEVDGKPARLLIPKAADPATFAKFCGGRDSVIGFSGKLVDASGALLPYQEAGHYVPPFELSGSIKLFASVAPSMRRLELDLWLPFEDRNDPGFLALLDRMRAIVGKVFRPKHFKLFSSSADGKKAVVRPNA